MNKNKVLSDNISNPYEYTKSIAGDYPPINILHFKLFNNLVYKIRRKKRNIVRKYMKQHSIEWTDDEQPDMYLGKPEDYYNFSVQRFDDRKKNTFDSSANRKWFQDNKIVLDMLSEQFPELLI